MYRRHTMRLAASQQPTLSLELQRQWEQIDELLRDVTAQVGVAQEAWKEAFSAQYSELTEVESEASERVRIIPCAAISIFDVSRRLSATRRHLSVPVQCRVGAWVPLHGAVHRPVQWDPVSTPSDHRAPAVTLVQGPCPPL